jgi:3-oxoacyl-[acyl-carrier protein] reductase
MLSRSLKDMDILKKRIKDPSKHICIKVDLLKNSNIKTAIRKAISFHKQIDIVVHVAGGGLGIKEPLLTSKDINKLLQLNLLSAIEINRILLQYKKKNKHLKLVHVGSIASYEAVGSVGYNTSKSALCGYVRSLGRELYSRKVVVTGIMPGGFVAPNNAMQRLKNKNLKVYNRFIRDRLPRKKMGTVDEILPMLLFLCSDSSSMMGGCMVPIDAGEGKSYLI